MNLRQLRSLKAVRQQGSFAAAGDLIGLSHAAVSIQMQQLEAALGVELFDRRSRPIGLTADGMRIASLAEEVLDRIDHINRVAAGAETVGSISIGFIPTSVPHLLPRVLTSMREQYPDLQVKVKSGLSGELSAALVRRELDYALLTTPIVEIPELEFIPIASEPLVVIGPGNLDGIKSDAELLRQLPYIGFNRRTWVGQHIAAKLQQRGIHVNEIIEIDSLEAIENLVAEGFGASIVPQRLHSDLHAKNLLRLPFGKPAETRELSLGWHATGADSQIDTAIKSIFLDLV